jgi:hypothetical protein
MAQASLTAMRQSRTQTMNSTLVDKRMAASRVREGQLKQLTAVVQQNSIQTDLNRSELLVAKKQRANAQAQASTEMMIESNHASRTKQRSDRTRLQTQNAALATEMMKRRADEERSEREIQRICEQSEELRDLEAKLKVAYMSKERAMQLEEKGMITEMEMRQEQAISDQMEYDRQQALAEMEGNEVVRRQHMIVGRHLLEEQMSKDAYDRMVESQQQAETDKLMVSDVMRKIEEEDYAEYQEKNRKVRETISAIDGYSKQREAELQQAAADAKADEDRILAYAQQKGAREGIIKKQQDLKRAGEEAKFKSIEAEMRRKMREDEEFEELRSLLLEQETELRIRKAEIEKRQKADNAKVEMMEANEQQRVLKQHLLEQQLAEEEELRQLTLAKFQADVELDRQAQARREESREEYIVEINEQRKMRADAFELEKRAELEARRRLDEEEAFKRRVVEEARKRLLSEHVAKLDGYLPKGVLKSSADLVITRQAREGGQY